jgi:hypothetical protein
MAKGDLDEGFGRTSNSPGHYDNKKPTRRCEAEHHESG